MQQPEESSQHPLKEHQIFDSYCVVLEEVDSELGDFQWVHFDPAPNLVPNVKQDNTPFKKGELSEIDDERQALQPDQASFDALFVHPQKMNHELHIEANLNNSKYKQEKSPNSLGLGVYALSLFKQTYLKSKKTTLINLKNK